MRKIGFFIAVLSVCCLLSCKKKKAPIIEAPAVVVTEEVKPVSELPEKEELKPVAKEYTHFLIGGCFRSKANADQFQAKLKNEGYPSEIHPYYHSLYLVTYKGFYSHMEAQIALNQIVYEPGKEWTWIYPVK